ncbi:hypothetical protein FTX61_21575 [Nitriliruptoraceae bacterium ZYF776]|nr:hypothetical protein [Profundirhabdus halotolerans]
MRRPTGDVVVAVSRCVWGALAALVMIAVAGCAGESEPGPLSLDRGGDTGQVEDPEEPTSPSDDDGGPGDDWLPPEDVQALYASLPPLEPDLDSPVDEVTQREVLAAHERFHHVVQAAYATAEIDDETAREIMTEEVAAAAMAAVGDFAESGTVQRTSSAEVRWVRVVDATDDKVLVRECNLVPPDAVIVDEVSGEPVEGNTREATMALLYELSYEQVASISPRSRWRVASVEPVDPDGSCGA